jgi:hypothetical protein
MMYVQRVGARAEYRRREFERISGSPTLAQKFPRLKSLRVMLEYCDPDGVTASGRMKYTVNIQHAKSVFCFNCTNGECVGGDYDLTIKLSDAILALQTNVDGEIHCPGTRHSKKDHVPCQNLLRYNLRLAYL